MCTSAPAYPGLRGARLIYVVDGAALLPLTQGQVARVDPEALGTLAASSWHARWDPAGRYFYAVRKNGRGTMSMHRQVLGGNARYVDHRNGDTLNNTRNNLRRANAKQNHGNQRLGRSNRTGFKGVFVKKGRFVASIGIDRKSQHLGYFATAEDAARAYDTAARKTFGRFAALNFPRTGERGVR